MTDPAKWILESWTEELRTVLQFLTGEDWTVTWSDVEPGSSPGNCFWWTQGFNAGPNAAIAIGAPALAWSELGARILQAAGVELIEQASARSTYLEAIQQSMSGLCRALTDRLTRPVEATAGHDEAPDFNGPTVSVKIAGTDFELPPLRVVLSGPLITAVSPRGELPPPAFAPPDPPRTPALTTAVATATPPAPSRTMSVLLDVQMPVSISFGRSSMPLREVMKLTTGSAVELDRRPDDEVDVIVNNCVIAKGEVVVINGNYGVRITEIISREQRMALRPGTRA